MAGVNHCRYVEGLMAGVNLCRCVEEGEEEEGEDLLSASSQNEP